jgi:hypothetical protein
MMAQACNPNYSGGGDGGNTVQGQPTYMGSINRKITV